MRRAEGVPSFRGERAHEELREAVRETRRKQFRIAHYKIHPDHVHLIVEATDDEALAEGLKGFAVRAARALNTHVLERSGTVWGDRYHRRELRTARQVRDAVLALASDGLDERVSPTAPAVEPAQTWLLVHAWHGVPLAP
jgi:REP element-mobilizing transposase RayT